MSLPKWRIGTAFPKTKQYGTKPFPLPLWENEIKWVCARLDTSSSQSPKAKMLPSGYLT